MLNRGHLITDVDFIFFIIVHSNINRPTAKLQEMINYNNTNIVLSFSSNLT